MYSTSVTTDPASLPLVAATPSVFDVSIIMPFNMEKSISTFGILNPLLLKIRTLTAIDPSIFECGLMVAAADDDEEEVEEKEGSYMLSRQDTEYCTQTVSISDEPVMHSQGESERTMVWRVLAQQIPDADADAAPEPGDGLEFINWRIARLP